MDTLVEMKRQDLLGSVQIKWRDYEFLFKGTMDEFIENCIPFMLESCKDMTADQARDMMKQQFPQLKRWKQA
ncbi:MAG: zinc ribbon domain-containing protein [Clostridium sp.]|nr:zinc ribbon domain-containing protein [Clostridium sp.]